MESFFALLQTNVLNRKTWTSRDELASAVIGWIERTYTADAANAASAN